MPIKNCLKFGARKPIKIYRATGAKLDSVVFDELAELAQTLGIDFPFEREVVEA